MILNEFIAGGVCSIAGIMTVCKIGYTINTKGEKSPVRLAGDCSPSLLEIRVLQGFFTNTYNKPYPIGCSRCEQKLEVFQKKLHAVKKNLRVFKFKKNIRVFKTPLGFFHSVKNPVP
jgi:hypothetical protein